MNNNNLQEMMKIVPIKGTPLADTNAIDVIVANTEAEVAQLTKQTLTTANRNLLVAVTFKSLFGVNIDLIKTRVETGITQHDFDVLMNCGINKVSMAEYHNSLDLNFIELYKANSRDCSTMKTINSLFACDYMVDLLNSILEKACPDGTAESAGGMTITALLHKLKNKEGELTVVEDSFLAFVLNNHNGLCKIDGYRPVALADFNPNNYLGTTEAKNYKVTASSSIDQKIVNVIARDIVKALPQSQDKQYTITQLQSALASVFATSVGLLDKNTSTSRIPRIDGKGEDN